MSMEELARRQCVPCQGSTPRLTGATLQRYTLLLGNGWDVVDEQRLVKSYQLADFATALALVNRIGAIAEAENHHPDLHLGWGKVGVEIWTHAIGGLSESDFVLAAKIEQAAR
jgi:4a-hydroxytetrahydrobiopterin dehydratase